MGKRRAKRRPQRTCVACRRVGDKRGFVRIVRTPERRVVLDLKGKVPGRGAYVCRNRDCWLRARHEGALARALSVRPTDEDLALLDAYFADLAEQRSALAPESGETAEVSCIQ